MPNADQAEAWNGAEEHHWVANAARHDRMLSGMTRYLLDAAGIQQSDSVLDIGRGCGATPRQMNVAEHPELYGCACHQGFRAW